MSPTTAVHFLEGTHCLRYIASIGRLAAHINRLRSEEEFEKTASLCARLRVQGEAGFGRCVLGIESAWIASKVVPVASLDVPAAYQDFGSRCRRSHLAVSTICRLNVQPLHHLSTSAMRPKTWEPLAVEATLLFPRHTDLTRSQPVRPLSTPVPRFKTSEPITVEATLLIPRYADLTRSVTSRSLIHQTLSSNIPTAAPASPLDVHDATQDFVAHRRRSHLPLSTICRLDAQPLYHFSTSTTRFKTSEPIAVEATLLFPRYADLTRSQPLYHFSTFVSRFKTLAVEGMLNSGIVFHHRPPRRLHVRRSLLAAPVPVFVASPCHSSPPAARCAPPWEVSVVVVDVVTAHPQPPSPPTACCAPPWEVSVVVVAAVLTAHSSPPAACCAPPWEVSVVVVTVATAVFDYTLSFLPAVRVLCAAVIGLVRRRRHRLDSGIRLEKAPCHSSPPSAYCARPWKFFLIVVATVLTVVSLGKPPAISPRRLHALRRRVRSCSSSSSTVSTPHPSPLAACSAPPSEVLVVVVTIYRLRLVKPSFPATRVLRAAVESLVHRRHRLDSGIRLGKATTTSLPASRVLRAAVGGLVVVAATVSTAVSDMGKVTPCHPSPPSACCAPPRKVLFVVATVSTVVSDLGKVSIVSANLNPSLSK
ncbi:hypothetical protein B0H11DRAFT_2253251 [Mycena galericulata]|nr:hypothetical protein B0H11DRAFT_2253251 [Mycena galericulata]